jgi:hypothetical protein
MSLTAPRSRKITRGDRNVVGDHVQVGVDQQYKLLVEHEVT